MNKGFFKSASESKEETLNAQTRILKRLQLRQEDKLRFICETIQFGITREANQGRLCFSFGDRIGDVIVNPDTAKIVTDQLRDQGYSVEYYNDLGPHWMVRWNRQYEDYLYPVILLLGIQRKQRISMCKDVIQIICKMILQSYKKIIQIHRYLI